MALDEDLTLIEHFVACRRLSISGHRRSGKLLSAIVSRFPDLTSLTIQLPPPNEDSENNPLRAISNPHKIKRFSIGGCLCDADLDVLSRFNNLEELCVTVDDPRASLSEAGLESLATLSKLRKFVLRTYGRPPMAIHFLSRCRQIESVTVNFDPPPASLEETLATLGHLRTLILGDTVRIDDSIAAISRLDQLELLDLSYHRLAPANVARLRQMLPRTRVYTRPSSGASLYYRH
jgi:hypothetical protein